MKHLLERFRFVAPLHLHLQVLQLFPGAAWLLQNYCNYLLSQILAIPIVCWVREKSAATPDTSGRSRPISAYFASESSLALGKWQNCESNRKKNQIQTLHTWPQGQAFVEVIWTIAESKSGQKMRKIIETRACVFRFHMRKAMIRKWEEKAAWPLELL